MTATGHTDIGLARLRAEYADRWDILHTTFKWYAIRRSVGHGLKKVSAHTARGLLRDLERVEEAAK